MSEISPEKINKIANLAKIHIEAAKLPDYAQDLSNILRMVERMQQVDTKDIVPMSHPLDATQPQRADETTEKDFSKAIEGFAPALEANLFLVPQVIE